MDDPDDWTTKERNMWADPKYKMYEQVVKFFIFLEDWKPGHFLQIGNSFVRWRKGDLISFDWNNMRHASSNAGQEPRCLIQVTGVMSDKTKELFLGRRKRLSL